MTTTPPAAPHPIRVGLADDDALVRRLLTQVIDRDPGLCVAWAVGNGTEVLNRLLHASDDDAPQAPDVDVLLLDINMPGTNGVDAAKALHEVYPDLPVIMLTTLDRTEYVTDVMGAGAVGFLRKDDREDRLLTAIRAAHQGIAVFSMETARRLVKRTPLSDERSDRPPVGCLRGNREIADFLDHRQTQLYRPRGDGQVGFPQRGARVRFTGRSWAPDGTGLGYPRSSGRWARVPCGPRSLPELGSRPAW